MAGTATHAQVVSGQRWALHPALVALLASTAVAPLRSLLPASPTATSIQLVARLHAQASQLVSSRLTLQFPHLPAQPQTAKANTVPFASLVNVA
jgi:hypothetical protein